MPPYEVEAMTSWADRVELEEQTEGDLPAPTEHFDERKGIKIITEYKFNEDGKKVKIVRTFKIEKRKVAKSIATRKSSWKKFGASKNDKPGPDPATTIPSEEIYMQFVSAKDGDSGASTAAAQDDDPMNKLKGQKIVQCRVCKGDHWTTKCPYKDKLAPIEEKLPDDLDGVKEGSPAGPGAAAAAAAKPAPGGPPPGAGGGGGGGGAPPGKYVPPSLRGKDKAAAGDRGPGGGGGGGESMPSNRSRDEAATIRVSNLPEDIRESDLQELFRSFGGIARIYLAKDKVTHTPKGFAFINFHKREDAAKAIAGVSGYGYDHLILNVEWAKPSGN